MNESILKTLSLVSAAASGTPAAGLTRGYIIEIAESGHLIVGSIADPNRHVRCDVLESSDLPLGGLKLGDQVLAFFPADQTDGIVLGRIARYRSQVEGAKKDLVLQAAETVTIQCGESALKFRQDGKVMLLGKDVLVRAKQTARIKGGSVAIN